MSSERSIKIEKVDKQNIPQLRFSGFDEEWNEHKLNDVCTITMGQSPSSINYTDNPDAIVLIQGNQDLMNGKIVPRIYTTEITKKSIPGDIILTVRAPVGDIAINEYNACIGRGVCALSNIQDFNFIYYYLEYLSNKQIWNKYSQGSTFESINSKDIKNLKIKIPSLEEQNKISDLITTLDDKISFMEKKKIHFQRIKKYFLSNMFCDKQNVPELRFPEFESEWKNVVLNDVADVRDGTHDSPKYVEKGFPLITSKNLLENGNIDTQNVNYINKEDYEKINKRSEVSEGDILFGMIGTIGNPVLVKSPGFAIKNVALIKEQNQLKNSFLIHYLRTNSIFKQFYKYNAGGTQKFIALGLIRNLNVQMPTIQEQNKLSAFISAIDKKIELMEKEILKNKQFKKSLLSKMFC